MPPRLLIGLDLGGTLLKFAVLAGDHAVLERGSAPSGAADGAEEALEAAFALGAEVARRHGGGPSAVGVGLPGAVDGARGRLSGPTPHLPGAEELAIRDLAAARLGTRVYLDNDANCAARAEARLGAARGTRSALVVTLGTGVGAGYVEDGRVMTGAHGGACEIGHWPIGTGEIPCRCGVPRCAEPEMSASGLARLCEARGLPWRSPAEVFSAATAGDGRARELTGRFADRLGATLAIAAQLVDCERIVLGGGVPQAEGFPFDVVRSAARGYLQRWRRALGLPVVPAELGPYAGAIGAALLAAESVSAG